MTVMVLYITFLVLSIVTVLLVDRAYRLKRKKLIDRTKFFFVFDKVLVIASVIAILISLLWDFNFLRYSRAIEHKNWEEITFTDFRGLNRPFQTLEGSNEFAFISSTIDVARRGNGFKIRALFHPCRSYVYNNYAFGPSLLTHELTHFHITEYHARLLREAVVTDANFDIGESKEKMIQRERKMQELYDYDTYHGQLNGKQLEWQHRMDSLLVGLKDFEAISVNSLQN